MYIVQNNVKEITVVLIKHYVNVADNNVFLNFLLPKNQLKQQITKWLLISI